MTMPLPEAIIAVWAPFAALFTQPVWHHVQVLCMGAVLCRGPHTMASVLLVMLLPACVQAALAASEQRRLAQLRAAGIDPITGLHQAAGGPPGRPAGG